MRQDYDALSQFANDTTLIYDTASLTESMATLRIALVKISEISGLKLSSKKTAMCTWIGSLKEN